MELMGFRVRSVIPELSRNNGQTPNFRQRYFLNAQNRIPCRIDTEISCRAVTEELISLSMLSRLA